MKGVPVCLTRPAPEHRSHAASPTQHPIHLASSEAGVAYHTAAEEAAHTLAAACHIGVAGGRKVGAAEVAAVVR